MVHVADNSLYGFGYREINQQLAKDNGELRQQLSLAFQENSQQRIELHKKDVELIELRRQVQELTQIREKYDAIREIISSDRLRRPVESICGPQSQTLTRNSEDESEKEDDGEDVTETGACPELPLPTSTTQHSEQSNYLQPIEEEDSLNPPDVTSVPPITHDDRSLATPSIWNCLDTLAPEPSPVKISSPLNLKAMFESTPVQPPSTVASLAAQARHSRGSDRCSMEQQHNYQQQPTRYNLRKRAKR